MSAPAWARRTKPGSRRAVAALAAVIFVAWISLILSAVRQERLGRALEQAEEPVAA